MKYKNVTKELMVKYIVINGESKYNSAYVNYHLIFKAVSVLCLFGTAEYNCWTRTHNIHVTHLERHTFRSCNNLYKKESRNFMTFFLYHSYEENSFIDIYFDFNYCLHSYNVYVQLKRVIQLLIIILLRLL